MVAPTEHNNWTGSGVVVQQVRHGRLSDGSHACTFQIEVPTVGGSTTWLRVNVYDSTLVRYVDRHVQRGVRLRVGGELMNRKTAGRNGSQLTEVRALRIDTIED